MAIDFTRVRSVLSALNKIVNADTFIQVQSLISELEGESTNRRVSRGSSRWSFGESHPSLPAAYQTTAWQYCRSRAIEK